MATTKKKNVVVTVTKVPNGSKGTKPTPKKNAELTDAQRKTKIDKLLDELRSAQFPSKKKQVRRSLRALGHRGGMKAVEAKK